MKDSIEGIDADIHGKNKIDSRYLSQMEEDAFSVLRNFVDLLCEFRQYFNFDWVQGDILLKMHKTIKSSCIF